MTDEQRLTLFIKEIEKEAAGRKKRLDKQANVKIKNNTRTAFADIDEELNEMIRIQCTEYKNSHTKIVSDIKSTTKKSLLEKREKASEQIFSEVAEKLEKFTKTEEYINVLKKSVDEITENFSIINKVYARSDDVSLLTDLSKLKGIDVETDNDITIGGIKALVNDGKLFIDDTFDSRLKKQHNWFSENSGLIIS